MSGEEAPKSVDIFEVILAMVDQIASVGWQKLGLQPDFLSGQISPDLPQAKVAIDLTSYLADLLNPQLDESDRRELQNLVSNLRLNYVQKAKELSE